MRTTQETVIYSSEVPVYGYFDVIVVGGGPAGIAATISAAKLGANVALIEQNGVLGGLGTSGLMSMYITPGGISGLGREIIDEVRERGQRITCSTRDQKHSDNIPFHAEAAKLVYDDLIDKCGATLFLYTKLIGQKFNGRTIEGIVVAGAEGLFYLGAKMFIDTTGDGYLSMLCGVPYVVGDDEGNTQAPTMVAYYSNIDRKKMQQFYKVNGDDHVKTMQKFIEKAYNDGVLPVKDMHHPGAFMISDDMAVVNAGHVYGADCLTSRGLTKATIEGRKQAETYIKFYRKYIGGFENAQYAATGSVLGIRETRRVIGAYILCYDDKLNYRRFDDAVGRYPGGPGSDIHASSPDQKAYEKYYSLYTAIEETTIPEKDRFYEMPYRALITNEVDNLLIAGRCASMDRKVNGQLRVMGPCFMMGQAAGTAAALCVKSGVAVKKLDVSALRETLVAGGMML